MRRNLTPEVRRQFSEAMRQRNADPIFRAKQALAMRDGTVSKKGNQTRAIRARARAARKLRKPRFTIPDQHAKAYRKLCHAIGIESARAELRRLIAQDALNASPPDPTQ